MSVTLKKDVCDRYTIRSSHWWAVIMLTKDGFVSIQSDYGDYNYHWNARNDNTIQEFLISCDTHYLMEKFGGQLPKDFNCEKTIQNIKRDVLQQRRQNNINADRAAYYRNRINDLSLFDISTPQELMHEMLSVRPEVFEDKHVSCSLLELYDNDPSAVPFEMENPYQLRTFFEKIWPVFIESLKDECSACDTGRFQSVTPNVANVAKEIENPIQKEKP